MKRGRNAQKQEVPKKHPEIRVGRQGLCRPQLVEPAAEEVAWKTQGGSEIAKLDRGVRKAGSFGRDAACKLAVLAHDQIGSPGLDELDKVAQPLYGGRADKILLPRPLEPLSGIGWRRRARDE